MASEVTVFVCFRDGTQGVSIEAAFAALKEAHSDWTIVKGGSVLSAGLYDQAPVKIYLNQRGTVEDEAREMAADAVRAGLDPETGARVAAATSRFEVVWDTEKDEDPVPETASVVIGAAQLLAKLTGGVPLINGHRPLDMKLDPDDLSAHDVLFPE